MRRGSLRAHGAVTPTTLRAGPCQARSLRLHAGERSGPSIRRYAGWLAQDTSDHDSWICTHTRGQLHLDLLRGPPRYEEQRCPLVACSDVIGSNVTNVLVWKRQLTASPLPQPLAGGGAHALRAWHAAAVEKKRTAGVAVRRLVLAPRRVDWPAQPSLDLAQNYFSRISWIVSIASPTPLLVAIGALPDLCLGIVSARLGHLDPWIPSYGHSLKAPDVPGAFFCSLKRGNRGAGRSLGTSGTRKSPA